MSNLQTESTNETDMNRNEDIDSKIADFMADIDEIVLGKKLTTNNNHNDENSEWKECFDETSKAIYYWNTVTNECSWDPPSTISENNLQENCINSTSTEEINKKKRQQQQPTVDKKSPKKLKKPSIIAEYASSDSEISDVDEENVDDIDELLNEVLDKEENKDKKHKQVDLYPLFEADSKAAIARLNDLGDKRSEILTLRIQLETRLEDCLSGHLSKSYALSKLEQAIIKIEELEKSILTPTPLPINTESLQTPLTSSEMALLLSLPPPPPPPSPPPPPVSSIANDPTLQLFYAQLNCDESESNSSDIETNISIMKSEQQPIHNNNNHHHHYHHHKDKKMKPSKTLPTDLIQKWTHARQELRGVGDNDES